MSLVDDLVGELGLEVPEDLVSDLDFLVPDTLHFGQLLLDELRVDSLILELPFVEQPFLDLPELFEKLGPHLVDGSVVEVLSPEFIVLPVWVVLDFREEAIIVVPDNLLSLLIEGSLAEGRSLQVDLAVLGAENFSRVFEFNIDDPDRNCVDRVHVY